MRLRPSSTGTTRLIKSTFRPPPSIALFPCRSWTGRVLHNRIRLYIWVCKIWLQQRRHHEREVEPGLAHQFTIVERDDGERVANHDRILSRAVDLSPEAFRKVCDLRLTPLDKACMQSQQNDNCYEHVTHQILAHWPETRQDTNRWYASGW